MERMAQEGNIEMSQEFYMEIWNRYERSKELEEENRRLKEDIKKWEDKRMVKLAEIYNMPTKYLTTAIVKNEWYSSRYDTVKRKMLHELGFDRLDVQDLLKENKKLKEENEALKEWVAKGMHYKNTYNDAIPRDENGFYKEVKPTC